MYVIRILVKLCYYIMSYNHRHVEALVLRDSARVVPVQDFILLVCTSLRYNIVWSICKNYPQGN